MFISRLSVIIVAGCFGTSLFGHEFWIEPRNYQVESDAALVADLKNGQKFKGIDLGWFENRATRFDLIQGTHVAPVTGRMGDVPAITITGAQGLGVIIHESTPSRLKYHDWDKFVAFADHKDFPDAAADHLANGWPQTSFYESYTRHVKTLVQFGPSGDGSDSATGMRTEFVALTNPYGTEYAGVLNVLLLDDDTPRADAQIEVFEKSPMGDVAIYTQHTDANGTAMITTKPAHEYLLDAVILVPHPEAGETQKSPLWQSFWAALTFIDPRP